MHRIVRRSAAALLCVSCAGVLALAQGDVFAQLGSNQTEAREQVFMAFSSEGFIPYGAGAAFKAAEAEARVAIVKSVIAFARTYAGSPDFAKRYAQLREDQKPEPPEAARTGDSVNDATKREMQKAIAEAEKMAKANPSMKPQMDEMIAQLRQQLAEIGKDAEVNKAMDDALRQEAELNQKRYQEDLARWEAEYPANVNALVAARLKRFLEVSATVDFAAQTAPGRDKKLRFVNPAHEARDKQWKMMYRAGRPAVEAARAAAQEWLKALGA